MIDEGCGIDPAIRDKIFDPFFTTKPVGKGTGLGLSISYGIVHSQGGRIELDSSPGKGSRFTIHLRLKALSAVDPRSADGVRATTVATAGSDGEGRRGSRKRTPLRHPGNALPPARRRGLGFLEAALRTGVASPCARQGVEDSPAAAGPLPPDDHPDRKSTMSIADERNPQKPGRRDPSRFGPSAVIREGSPVRGRSPALLLCQRARVSVVEERRSRPGTRPSCSAPGSAGGPDPASSAVWPPASWTSAWEGPRS